MGKKKTNDCLEVFLDYEWFDKIQCGKKTVEYRRICPFWATRIFAHHFVDLYLMGEDKGKAATDYPTQLKKQYIRFHRAYTSTVIVARITKVDIGPCPYQGWDGDFYRIHFEPTNA